MPPIVWLSCHGCPLTFGNFQENPIAIEENRVSFNHNRIIFLAGTGFQIEMLFIQRRSHDWLPFKIPRDTTSQNIDATERIGMTDGKQRRQPVWQIKHRHRPVFRPNRNTGFRHQIFNSTNRVPKIRAFICVLLEFSLFDIPEFGKRGVRGAYPLGKTTRYAQTFFPADKHPVPLASQQNLEGYADAKTGRLCPRSVVHCCTGSFCSGTFTNSRNRLRFSGSSTAVFHSHW